MNEKKKGGPKCDRASKVKALQFIKSLPAKPNQKKYSMRELSRRVTHEIGRYVSHTTISDWMKSENQILKQPEAENDQERHWKLKSNRQYRLIPLDRIELEDEIDRQLDGLFTRGNVTLSNLSELARKLAADRGLLKKPTDFGRRWSREFCRRRKLSYRQVLGSKKSKFLIREF